jgi:hypothetical protein
VFSLDHAPFHPVGVVRSEVHSDLHFGDDGQLYSPAGVRFERAEWGVDRAADGQSLVDAWRKVEGKDK